MDAKLKFPWFTGRMGPLALVVAFGLWSDRDDKKHTNTLYFEAVPDPHINLPAKNKFDGTMSFYIIGFWATLSLDKPSYWSYVLYIYISSNITIQLCLRCHPHIINIIEHPYGLWFWSLLTWESFVPIFTIPLLPPRILSEPTSFLTQRNVRRLERCSSHHGRCSRRGAASYGGSSRGSPSAVDVEIEVAAAGAGNPRIMTA